VATSFLAPALWPELTTSTLFGVHSVHKSEAVMSAELVSQETNSGTDINEEEIDILMLALRSGLSFGIREEQSKEMAQRTMVSCYEAATVHL
jgi:hypothetical protein